MPTLRKALLNMYLKNVQVYQNGAFKAGSVLCEDGIIKAVGAHVQNNGEPELDCGGKRLVPGFIDAHTHDAVGVDVNTATKEGLRKVSAFFASQGTTSWLASVLTDTENSMSLYIQE